VNLDLSPLERAVEDPTVGRVVLILLLVGGAALANHQAGFTHHYDLSRQLTELERLQRLAAGDTTVEARADSLQMSVLRELEERQAQDGIGVPREELKRLVALIIPIFLLYVLVTDLMDDDDPDEAEIGWSAIFFLTLSGATYVMGMAAKDTESTTLALVWVVIHQLLFLILAILYPSIITWVKERVVGRIKNLFSDGDG
jgi:hypothetical protein